MLPWGRLVHCRRGYWVVCRRVCVLGAHSRVPLRRDRRQTTGPEPVSEANTNSLSPTHTHTHTRLTMTKCRSYNSTHTQTHTQARLTLTPCTAYTSTHTHTHYPVTQCTACNNRHRNTPTHTDQFDSKYNLYQHIVTLRNTHTQTQRALWLVSCHRPHFREIGRAHV